MKNSYVEKLKEIFFNSKVYIDEVNEKLTLIHIDNFTIDINDSINDDSFPFICRFIYQTYIDRLIRAHVDIDCLYKYLK